MVADHTEGFGEGVTASLVERMGLFTIIVLGEVVVGVVGGISDAEHRDLLTITTGMIGLTIGMGMWWNYFDMLGRRVPGRRGRRLAGWLYSHLPLTMAISASGAAMVSLLEHAGDSRTPTATGWLLVGSVVIVLGSVTLACTALPTDEFPDGMVRYIAPCFGAAAALVVVDRARPTGAAGHGRRDLRRAAPGLARVVRRLPRPRRRSRRHRLRARSRRRPQSRRHRGRLESGRHVRMRRASNSATMWC